jgi:hypothetical protein
MYNEQSSGEDCEPTGSDGTIFFVSVVMRFSSQSLIVVCKRNTTCDDGASRNTSTGIVKCFLRPGGFKQRREWRSVYPSVYTAVNKVSPLC